MADSAAAYCCGGLLFLVIIVLFAVSMRTSRITRRYCQQSSSSNNYNNCIWYKKNRILDGLTVSSNMCTMSNGNQNTSGTWVSQPGEGEGCKICCKGSQFRSKWYVGYHPQSKPFNSLQCMQPVEPVEPVNQLL